MRALVTWSLAVTVGLGGLAPAGAAGPEPPGTEEQKTLYAVGVVLSRSLGTFGLSEAELAQVQAGLADGVLGRPLRVDPQAYGPKIQALQAARAGAAAATERKAGQAYVARAAAEKGATRTASGIVMTTLRAGTGPSPRAADQVRVHYHGTLTDGTVFDSSVERKEPATFALNRVIPCWTEAVQLMRVGGKSRLVCPADLAYGDRGAPPRIKPGATLVFEVELLEIVR
jgi:FKBP-type peptidyl-prolyl cis-trans isomerase FkpA/FKBP-type peptidyl-prolyl cis-trans isomerase FklB